MNFGNPYFAVILLSVVALEVLEIVASLLNLRRLSPALPKGLEDIYEPEAYAKSQAYTRESERFDILSGGIKLVVFLGFWLLGGFTWVDGLVRGWSDSPVWQGLAGMALLYAGSTLLSLPFDWYDTFRIEAKYGFNKTTPGTFVLDLVKGLVLGGVIGLPLMALLIWIFDTYENAWLWAWGSVTVVMLALQYIAPRWLMPLFNKFTPLPDGELKDGINALSAKCAFPISGLFVIDGSRRSTKANAFFAGFGKHKRIALYDTLIEKHPQPELIAVLAHEIGHFKCRHIVQRMVVGIVQMAFLFLLMGFFMKNAQLAEAFGVSRPSVWLSLVFFTFLFEPVQLLLSIAGNLWSRKHEFEADAYAARVTGAPGDMISGLKRLARDTLSNLTPHPLHVFLHYSHPPMPERLAALEKLRAAPAAV
jgi:STE24 endopeptidase